MQLFVQDSEYKLRRPSALLFRTRSFRKTGGYDARAFARQTRKWKKLNSEKYRLYLINNNAMNADIVYNQAQEARY